MGSNASRNLEDQRREQNGIVYFDRGTLTGKNGRQYDRYAIQTHFIEVGEDQAEIVRRYVLPLYREGDVLSFGAKVMAMCTRNVFTKEQIKPGFWAKLLSPHASETVAGIGMHDPYKLQLAINMVGAPRVVFASGVSALTKVKIIEMMLDRTFGKPDTAVKLTTEQQSVEEAQAELEAIFGSIADIPGDGVVH